MTTTPTAPVAQIDLDKLKAAVRSYEASGHSHARMKVADAYALIVLARVGQQALQADQFERGYFCAVSALLHEDGDSTMVRSLFAQGGDPTLADPIDIKRFVEHGLMPGRQSK